jgi:signal transduction histidine kinase
MNGVAYDVAVAPMADTDVMKPAKRTYTVLSLAPAGARERRLALGALAVSTVVFVAAAPFAKLQLTAIPAFLPAYQAALILNELLTALLLFGQFYILRSRALLFLAGAYLFSALMAVSHALSFPGLFFATGLLGAGPQTTAWIYFLWHAGFPLLVIVYALAPPEAKQPGHPRLAIVGCMAAGIALAAGLTLFTTAGHDLLPPIMAGNRDAPAKVVVAFAVWLLCLAALPLLWRRRPHSVLDLWLMVVMWVWVFDVALAAVLNAGRFDLGWYAGRVYGLLAGTFVLAVLLLENSKLYFRLAGVHQETERALARHAERLRILREIDRAMASDAPAEAIAAAVIQPLRKLLDVPRVHVNLIDYAAGEGVWLAAAGRRRTHVGPGVRFPLYMLGDLEALKRGAPQTVHAAALPASPQREALLASGVHHYLVTPMIAGGELIGALSVGAEQASFPVAQAAIAEEAATQLAVAITHARLSESVRRKAERLRIVHQIDRAILSEVQPEAIAAAVLQPLRELLAVPRVVVNLFDLAAGEVEWLAAAGRHHTRARPGVRYSLLFMGDVEALGRGEPQVIDTATLPEGEEKRALLASGVHHYMAVPMITGSALIGAVSFGGEGREFPPGQVAIVQEVATQMAIAISQARLLEQVRRHAAELESRVQERTAELEAANQELASFSYSVSHDLRAPLRAMDGYARMLEEDYAARLDDEGRRLLKVVRDNAGRMGRLIDDLLDFSRLGRQPMALHPLDMGALAREVVDEARAGQAAAVELGELPAARGDRALLKQVWLNLVLNAFKYSSKQAAPRIEIGGRAVDGEHHYWVRDNGVGFDMRYADKLFGVFQRLHRAEDFPGTGVGLAIVQRVIARHRGRVWAESAPGAGACFHFSLPRETT